MKKTFQRNAQVAVEYLILLGIVTAVVLAGFKKFLPRGQEIANEVFADTARGIMGQKAEFDSATGTDKVRAEETNYP